MRIALIALWIALLGGRAINRLYEVGAGTGQVSEPTAFLFHVIQTFINSLANALGMPVRQELFMNLFRGAASRQGVYIVDVLIAFLPICVIAVTVYQWRSRRKQKT